MWLSTVWPVSAGQSHTNYHCVSFNPFPAGPEYFVTHTCINNLSIILGCRKLLKVEGPSLEPAAIKWEGVGRGGANNTVSPLPLI